MLRLGEAQQFPQIRRSTPVEVAEVLNREVEPVLSIKGQANWGRAEISLNLIWFTLIKKRLLGMSNELKTFAFQTQVSGEHV